MQTGDIVFFKGKSWISKIISRLTGSPYTHVAIALTPDLILEADRFIKVRLRAIEDHEVYSIKRYEDITEEQKELIFAGGISFLGVKYDYLNILLWLLSLLFNFNGHGLVNNANSVYCSELVDRLYLLADIDLLPNNVDGDILPVHLLNSPLLTEV
jgi:Permuted papain-like amidase enzyme, YaeF/YiiX, C92 family